MAAQSPLSLFDQALSRLLLLLPDPQAIDWSNTHAAVWQRRKGHGGFVAHGQLDNIALDDLLNIDDQRAQLVSNTEQFLAGLPANNALLWGARGTGKSSLIHALLNQFAARGLRLVELHKDHLADLGDVVAHLAREPFRYVVFCDDLSFDADDASYKSLKSALEGSIFTTTENILIYATSNRRHLVPEHMSDNLQTRVGDAELHESEAVEEKISLSDRFGLWLSFYPFRQEAYLQVVRLWVSRLAQRHGIEIDAHSEEVRTEALRWALARGVRNGRTAQYFARHWVGQKGLKSARD
ncbi:MAG: ATP-binding protein [bacterium]